MSDPSSPLTFESLCLRLKRFRDERNWEQFHKPKDLAMAVTIEANELLEHFLWKTEQETEDALNGDERQKIEDELADVIITTMNFGNKTGMDVLAAVQRKIEKNETKYPVEKSRGNAKKYTEFL